MSVGGAGRQRGEGLSEVCAVEDTSIGRDPDLTGLGRVSSDVADLGDVGERGLGKSRGAVGGDVEDSLGAGVEDGVVLLVASDNATGRQGDVLELALVARGENTLVEGRPEDYIAIGGIGNGTISGSGTSGVDDSPSSTTIAAESQLGRAGDLAYASDLGDIVASEVDRDTACPPRVGPGGLGRRAEVSDRVVGEAVVIEGSHEQLGTAGGRGQAGDSHLFNSGSKTLDGDGLVVVPVGQIVTTVDGDTGAVEPSVAVVGVDLKRLDHPAKLLSVDVEEIGLDPGSLSVVSYNLSLFIVKTYVLGANSVLRRNIAISSPVPDLLPGSAGICRAEELSIGVPAVQSSDHDSAGLLRIDGKTTCLHWSVQVAQ